MITEYRSGIFTTTPEQEVTAKKVMAEVQAKHYPNTKIATIVSSCDVRPQLHSAVALLTYT